ncbi:hypothetical protein F0U61_31165 [Archangium violaceum]|uniref:hypothetical protein n=1 Tax=Archangium violaceum TaxID=83451 RepID=UPI002B31EDE4|nr:hypothetical protein F0U61_31165 [Archangium violaceum]
MTSSSSGRLAGTSDCEPATLEAVAGRCAGEGQRVLGLRFEGNPFVPKVWDERSGCLFWMCLREPVLHAFFVTSANHSLREEEKRQRPEEGNWFAFEAPVPGVRGVDFRMPGT